MKSLSTHHDIAKRLRSSGMSRRAANRMADEWRAHREDLDHELALAGFSLEERRLEIDQRMGRLESAAMMVATMPTSQLVVLRRHAAAIAFRWSGACVAGFVTTLCLFAVMNFAIAI
ncbi:MAG: hypothetical protein AAAFM81_09835 [Pseudomonadota bacterium]